MPHADRQGNVEGRDSGWLNAAWGDTCRAMLRGEGIKYLPNFALQTAVLAQWIRPGMAALMLHWESYTGKVVFNITTS